MNKTGIVLSGGGVRGFAHLGLLKLLDEIGLKPYAISGTSAGAIAGAMYLAGHSPEAILGILKQNAYFGWSNLLWHKDGFFSMQPLLRSLQKHIPQNSFESLAARFFVTATDFTHGKQAVFSSGPLYEPVIAAASVPVVFAPVKIGDSLLVDGGLLNNFPIDPLLPICDQIIGSHVNKLPSGHNVMNPVGKMNILEKCFHMAIAGSVEAKFEHCAVLIEPDLSRFSMFDVKKAEEVFEAGYVAAAKVKGKLEKLMQPA
ncbi:patatin-like phospholipase family protein [Paraflavitalea sp. CAU 1676]|uniref:patatin-like phospholipase family protein n=1 Tax=Paraflavitalea sp. CAU 1676 TaxID=3032598 RepID=UPI0023DC3E76|nr:patatin-like phospholipase family protein [Paraflavitalea sp. CAU 1676]MDF2190571.1 patatin-like phospholipase family protein [Paraflavitalea sp. CAU 1676]